IFNLLINGTHGNPVPGARVLDLFAGTGALGLEALSRGAAQATFVDDGGTALALLARNIGLMRAAAACEVVRRDARMLGPNRGAPFDLVFLDPPYGTALGELALALCLSGGWLAAGAMVVWEESSPQLPPAGFAALDQRQYGSTAVTLLRAPG
ncbi:MAG: 16S rRNA (guanine(966)-N(2))-methyltransferase RsmD, partial [Alphaproteobacteria bacterium HGW-Alphaproteobacteria-5]